MFNVYSTPQEGDSEHVAALRREIRELGNLSGYYDARYRRLANAAGKACDELYDTRRFVKSRQIQRIREDLDAALRG
mgnify:CR=1 FL=1